LFAAGHRDALTTVVRAQTKEADLQKQKLDAEAQRRRDAEVAED